MGFSKTYRYEKPYTITGSVVYAGLKGKPKDYEIAS